MTSNFYVEKIDKIKHPIAVEARNLNSSKIRNYERKVLLKGVAQFEWALNYQIKINYLILTDDMDAETFKKHNLPIYKTSNGIMKKITETSYPIPLVAVVQLKQFLSQDNSFTVILDNIIDFGNIGTIVRTAYAYGIRELISTKNDFDPYYQKIVDASRGTVLNTNIRNFNSAKDAAKYLKKKGYQIVTTSPHGNEIQSMVNLKNKPIALVLGNEKNGVSNEFLEESDFVMQIPMYTEVESLNVGVAAGISIYELKLKEVVLMLREYIQSTFGRNFNVVAHLAKEVFDSQIKSVSNYSADHIVFLMVLKCEEQIQIDTCGKQFGYFGHERTQFLDLLLKDKYIEKIGSKIQITKAGEEFLGKIWPIYVRTENILLKDFSEDENKMLKGFIEKIQNNCVKYLNGYEEKNI